MPRSLNKTSLWFRIIAGWLREQSMLWITVAGLLGAIAVVWLWPRGNGSDRIRYAGTLLQVAGFTTVWLGIDETRRLFGYERSFIAFWGWLRRCPWRGPRKVFASGNLSVALSGMKATATAGLVTAPGLTVEQRLDALTKRVDEMQRQHAEEIGKVREDLTHTKEAIRKESTERQSTTAKLNELLKRAQTGGLDMSLGGLLWLAVGVVATCIPDELAQLFHMSYKG